MSNKFTNFIIGMCNKEFFRFLMVGSFVTITNVLLIFAFYNLFNFGYWCSSALGYVVVTFVSYYLNKKYTFKFDNDTVSTLVKFIAVIAFCYVFSYLIARPLTTFVFEIVYISAKVSTVEQVAMLVGMVGSIVFNYIGQKWFVFH